MRLFSRKSEGAKAPKPRIDYPGNGPSRRSRPNTTTVGASFAGIEIDDGVRLPYEGREARGIGVDDAVRVGVPSGASVGRTGYTPKAADYSAEEPRQ